MNIPTTRPYLLMLFALTTVVSTQGTTPSSSVENAPIAELIKRDVAEVIAGINAHDPAKATAYDAPDVVSMECGRPSSVGIDADREGFKMGFTYQPSWKVSLIDESVDVAASGEMAVYRGTYNEDNRRGEVQLTHKVNFIAEFRRQKDDAWKIVWYIVSEMEKAHPKR